MSGRQTGRQGDSPLLTVSCVADSYRPYPGDTVAISTRVEVGEAVAGFTLRLTVPPGLSLDAYGALSGLANGLPLVTRSEGGNHLTWKVERGSGAATCYEAHISATVDPAGQDRVLEARAVVASEQRDGQSIRDEAIVTLAVAAKARSLQHLPALYQDDGLMGRFLMLFESFWTPIDRQIDSLSYYFDPRFTPPDLLPWLAAWINLVLDERWPEHKRRRLLRSAVPLYRKRGTRRGLAEYLEIYTGQRPRIIEHRAHNLALGPTARLGPGIALGTINMPHTFTVMLRLPPVSSYDEASTSKKERARLELERQRKIEAIIEAEKPAHTAYNLRLEIDPDLEMHETR
jgi:phage tail-like protein